MKRTKQFLSSPLVVVSGVMIVVLIVLAVIAPAVWGTAANTENPAILLHKPSGEHWFGTDQLGRDIFARTMVATRLSLVTALICTAISAVLGIIVGAVPVVFGKRAQRWTSSIINVWLAFPVILLAMLTVIALGTGATATTIALTITMTPTFARLAQTLSATVAGADYMAAARMFGVSGSRQVFYYILPEVAEPFVANVTQSIGGAILAMSSLSFLGLGVQPPVYDWGRLINEGFAQVYVSPMAAVGPGIAIVFAGLAFNLFGEGISNQIRRAYKPLPSALSKRELDNPPKMLDKTNMELVVEAAAEQTAQHRERVEALRAKDPDAAVVSVPRPAPVLSVRGLTVSFPEGKHWNTPVKGISFDVEAGEIVGLVGESGSGKSLTMMSVADLAAPGSYVAADSIRFDGTDIVGMLPKDKRKLLSGIGVVFQDSLTALNPAMRVGKQLAEVLECQNGTPHEEAMKQAVEMLEHVGIDPAQHAERKFPYELSGGMRQRAMIAMAEINHPKLIIADEPTTALDVTVQKQVLALLRNECARNKQAAVIVSHDIAVLGEICSRIMVMYHGAIVEIFDTALLRTPEKLKHPYTRALVSSIPTLATDKSRPLVTIDDELVSHQSADLADREAAERAEEGTVIDGDTAEAADIAADSVVKDEAAEDAAELQEGQQPNQQGIKEER